jgi:hypothetical protein
MLISAGGSSGGRGLVSASGIDSPPSPSPPPAMRHSPRPRLPPPLSAESRASPPLKGRIVRLEEAAGARPPEGLLPALAAASCRRAPAALEAALGEMEARGGGFVWRSGFEGAPLPRRRLPGAHPQPRSPRAASAPGAISRAAGPWERPRAFSAQRPVTGRGAASCRFQRRHPAAAFASFSTRNSPRGAADYFLPTNVS